MRHGDHRALILLQVLLQPVDRLGVEVVGRLVQQQNIALTVQNLAETYFCLLAAAQYTHLTLDVFGGQTAFASMERISYCVIAGNSLQISSIQVEVFCVSDSCSK